MNRRIFLTSRSSHSDAIKTLEVYLGGFKGQSVAYIPTASNGENIYGSWKREGVTTYNLFKSLNLKITPYVLEEEIHNNPNLISDISHNDILYMSGGMTGYLMYWLTRTGLDIEIPNMLDKGMLYVGSSAGSMVCSPTLEVCEWFIGEEERGTKYLPGLNLVDFDFYPHFNDSQLEDIKKLYKGNNMYLVRDGESIIVEGNDINLVGKPLLIP